MIPMVIDLSGVQHDNRKCLSSVRGFRLLATGKEIRQGRVGILVIFG